MKLTSGIGADAKPNGAHSRALRAQRHYWPLAAYPGVRQTHGANRTTEAQDGATETEPRDETAATDPGRQNGNGAARRRCPSVEI